MSHPTVTLVHDGEPIEIDRGIAELIGAMWGAGIETLQSCQDVGALVWVRLASVDDLRLLLSRTALAESDERGIFWRVRAWERRASGAAPQWNAWRFALNPYPEEEDDPASQWAFEVDVEFPPGDVLTVTERLTSLSRVVSAATTAEAVDCQPAPGSDETARSRSRRWWRGRR